MVRATPSIADYYRQLWEKVRTDLLKEPDSVILGTPTDELVEYRFSNNALQPLEIDSAREDQLDHRKEVRVVPAHQREEFYRSEGDLPCEFESVTIFVPITPNPNVATLQKLSTSTGVLNWSPREFSCNSEAISVTFDIKGYGLDLQVDQIAQRVQEYQKRIRQWITWVKTDVDRENGSLRQQIKAFVEERRRKIESDKTRLDFLIAKVNIPLRKHVGEATRRVQLDSKPLVRRVRPKPQLPEDYVLDQEKVLDVIEIIDNQCRQFERTPKTFVESKEEGLRNTILVGLNGVFAGKATGETFSVHGKTDIYLNIDKGNILVCECKFWEGSQLYLGTIDQLLGYLSWRHNYGIMITFVRRKQFSKVLEQVKETAAGHPSYRRGFRAVSETHFVSHHALPQDDTKEVEMHHLFYNVYVES